ncbi:MAG: pentapeptide repeat-containing protein [Candidatus Adiutrix sp.]|jgi:uncharacterized protein YjbI with pentapeptide repeats|nr:pentapeptide repeat-containing protein [Candidatus Adiutrix sp.]
MQVIKDIEQGLLFSAVGLGGKWYLQAAVMLFFDLNDPETALSEQQLWPLVQKRLGAATLLDAGFPKPRGEFLAAGRAFWPGNEKLKGSFRAATGREPEPGRALARIQVGPLSRTLAVSGPRRWVTGPAGPAPSAPGAFEAVPLTWESAYGGPGHEDNPDGLGAADLLSPAGEKYRPLPLVEDAARLVGGPDDRPGPASFLPRPLAWPSRKALAGTYDDFWLRERWPGFPDDLNPDLFSVAGTGQVLAQNFFQGGERIIAEGCHPEIYRQESFVPQKRVRLFATFAPDISKPGDLEFTEPQTRLETVWLFPEDRRGLVIHRALIPSADEEFTGIDCLFVAVEEAGSEPRTLAHYLEEQKRRRAVSVPVDMSPFQKAAGKVNAVVRNLRTLEQDVDLELARHLGQAPTAPRQMSEVIDDQLAGLGDLKSLLGDQKQLLRDSKKQFGHLMPIDVRMLAPMEESLAKMEGKIAAAKKTLAEAADRTSAMAARNMAVLRNDTLRAMPPDVAEKVRAGLANLGLDPETLAWPDPDDAQPWSREALKLLARGRRHLAADPDRLRRLTALGLRSRDLKAGLFGILPEPVDIDLSQWGLKEPPEGRIITLGPGWLVPDFEGPLAVSLLVRPFDDERPFSPVRPAEGDLILPGSRPGARLLGGGSGRPLLLAPDPFTAWLLYAEAGDQFMILQISDPAVPPPAGAGETLASAPLALLPVPAGQADDRALVEPWLGLLPGLLPAGFDKGEHLFEARRAGFDIRAWLMARLPDIGLEVPPEYGVRLPDKPEEAGSLKIKVPVFDIEGLVAKSRAKVEAFVAAKVGSPQAEFEKVKSDIKNEARQVDRYLKPHGHSVDEIFEKFKLPGQIKPPKPSGPNRELLANLDDLEKRLDKTGTLSDQGRAKLNKIRASHIEVAEKTADLHRKGEELLDWGRNLIKNPFPPEAVAEARAQGLELDPTPVTVEKIMGLKERGATVAGLDLSGLDFSGRDLGGLRLERCFLNQAVFRQADLSGSRWHMCSGRGADFTGARLDRAEMNLSSLSGSVFESAGLAGVQALQADFTGGTFNRTVFTGAGFDKCIFSKARFQGGGRLDRARFYMCIFNGTVLEKVVSADSSWERSTFTGSALSDVLFLKGLMKETLFVQSRLDKVVFEDGDLTNIRFNYHCELREVAFRRAVLDRASFNNALMPGTIFDHCRLAGASLEESDLSGSRLTACRAPGALIRKSDLRGGYLVSLDIQNGSFRRSNLAGADLSYANCHAAEFYKSVLADTDLTGANLRLTLLETREAAARREGFIRRDGDGPRPGGS